MIIIATVSSCLAAGVYLLICNKRTPAEDFADRNEEAEFWKRQYPYAERPFIAYRTTAN